MRAHGPRIVRVGQLGPQPDFFLSIPEGCEASARRRRGGSRPLRRPVCPSRERCRGRAPAMRARESLDIRVAAARMPGRRGCRPSRRARGRARRSPPRSGARDSGSRGAGPTTRITSMPSSRGQLRAAARCVERHEKSARALGEHDVGAFARGARAPRRCARCRSRCRLRPPRCAARSRARRARDSRARRDGARSTRPAAAARPRSPRLRVPAIAARRDRLHAGDRESRLAQVPRGAPP